MIQVIKAILKKWKIGLLLIGATALSTGTAFGGEALERHPTNPVSEFRTVDSKRPVTQKLTIEGSGRIDRIGEDEIVICDILRGLSPSVSTHGFRVGTFVGFRLNSRKEIIDLWVLDEVK
jgi:hypothetical protein